MSLRPCCTAATGFGVIPIIFYCFCMSAGLKVKYYCYVYSIRSWDFSENRGFRAFPQGELPLVDPFYLCLLEIMAVLRFASEKTTAGAGVCDGKIAARFLPYASVCGTSWKQAGMLFLLLSRGVIFKAILCSSHRVRRDSDYFLLFQRVGRSER